MPKGYGTFGTFRRQVWRACYASGRFATSRRQSFYSTYARRPHITSTADHELEVKVDGVIGSRFALKIHHPPRPESDSPIIIYLKRGIPIVSAMHPCLKELALGANATAVEIIYTLSKNNPYPSPIHTTLAGYDWVRKYLARGKVAGYEQLVTTTKPSKIGVCGDLLGGSLATMLALTECQNPASNGGVRSISAVAVGNPIVDWTALSPVDPDPRISPNSVEGISIGDYKIPRISNSQTLTVPGLVDVRDVFFRKPENYFDPFASPLLYFRTPGTDVPNESQAEAESQSFRAVVPQPVSSANGSSYVPEPETRPFEPARRRRSHRKYPPTGFDLVLPHMRVEVGKEWVLKDQGMELIELVRKSFERTEDQKTSSGKSRINRSFEIIENEGLGLWDKENMFEIGQWFGDVLRRP